MITCALLLCETSRLGCHGGLFGLLKALLNIADVKIGARQAVMSRCREECRGAEMSALCVVRTSKKFTERCERDVDDLRCSVIIPQ